MSKEPGVIYPGYTTFDSEIIITEPITKYLVEHDCTYKFNGMIWGCSNRVYKCVNSNGIGIGASRRYDSCYSEGKTRFEIVFDEPFTGTITLLADNTHVSGTFDFHAENDYSLEGIAARLEKAEWDSFRANKTYLNILKGLGWVFVIWIFAGQIFLHNPISIFNWPILVGALIGLAWMILGGLLDREGPAIVTGIGMFYGSIAFIFVIINLFESLVRIHLATGLWSLDALNSFYH